MQDGDNEALPQQACRTRSSIAFTPRGTHGEGSLRRPGARVAGGMVLLGLVACMPEGAQPPPVRDDVPAEEGQPTSPEERTGDAAVGTLDGSSVAADRSGEGGTRPPEGGDARVARADAGAPDTEGAANDADAGDAPLAPHPEDASAPCTTCVDGSSAPVDPVDPGAGIPPDRRFADQGRQLNIMAHQDDDLGFVNPVVDATVRGGHFVGTLFVTGGNANWDCPAYEQDRNEGAMHAYAKMAGKSRDDWTASLVSFGGHELLEYRLPDTKVVLWFMRITNEATAYFPGADLSLGSEAHSGDLGLLWHRDVDEITALGASDSGLPTSAQHYEREELIEVMTEIIDRFEPTHVNLLDATEGAGFDHPDHVHASLFGLAAALRSERAPTVRMHETYGITLSPPNLPKAVEDDKRETFGLYLEHDPRVCDDTDRLESGYPECSDDRTARTCDPYYPMYHNVARAYYPITSTRGSRSRVATPGGRCLSAAAQEPDAPVRARPCDAEGVTKWHFASDGTLRSPSGDLCVHATSDDGALRLASCDPASQGQRWLLFDSGQLRGDGALCAEVSDDETGGVHLSDCNVDASERQVGWGLSFSSPTSWSAGNDFSVDALGDAASTYETIQLGDVDGDGLADACARHAEGIRCARNLGGRFDSWAPVLVGEFADDSGWADDAQGSTVQLADVNADGRADVCGRSAAGVRCAFAHGPGVAFAPSERLSGDFSNAAGFGSSESRYRSVRVVDVDGDGYGDVCGRSGDGVLCALFDPQLGRHRPAELWSAEFSDARGWDRPAFGGSLMFGDINGDQRQDVCGLANAGIVCAVGDGTKFHLESPWETRATSLGHGWAVDRAAWGSLRLTDIDGDGRADLCGRGAAGVQCRLSHGIGFGSPIATVQGATYADRNGFRNPANGATLRFGDLDGDGDWDLCVRGPLDGRGSGAGLSCSSF